eukprot:GFUD01114159.1.p1 GENE.GFUD01114159.1~~GFUD01114159.1.p1  ORF type:complete len:421 (+),score=114.93 GFUD01114159.1:57-1319(+)
MSKVLKFPIRLQNQAFKCLAVANASKTKVEVENCENCSKVSLSVLPGIEIFGSGAICKYLLDDLSADINAQSKILQWISFVDSEISPYPPGSKQMAKSLGYLEGVLSENKFLSSSSFSPTDILVGFPLLSLPSQIFSPHPNVSVWLDAVRQNTKPLSEQLVEAAKSSVDGEKSSIKGKKDAKPKKGKTDQGKKQADSKPAARKLRILCIHGYRQNGKTFREKLGSFRKLVGKQAEFEFVTAPHHIPSENPEEQDQFGWWFSQASKSFDAHEDSTCDLGFSESVSTVEEALVKGVGGDKFDGILAFSQGASLAAHLCVLQETGKLNSNFKFCILVAGFVSRTLQHKSVFQTMQQTEGSVTIPTLHVFGDTDKVIEKEMSEDLLQYFASPDIIRHPGGHFVPATGEGKKEFNIFLEKMQKLL